MIDIPTESPELQFAKTAALVERLPYPRSRDQLRSEIGNIVATLEAGESYRVNGDFTITPESYDAFLGTITPEHQADIEFHASKIGPEYDRFKDLVQAAIRHPRLSTFIGKIKFIGEGIEGKVFAIESEGEKYALKIGEIPPTAIRQFRVTDQIEDVPHLHAIDIPAGVVIMDFMPGKPIDSLSIEEQMAIPTEHIKALIEKSVELHNVGIFIDHCFGNFLYDPKTGFKIIDFYTNNPGAYAYSLTDQVMFLQDILSTDITPPLSMNSSDLRNIWLPKKYLRDINLLGRHLDILEEDYPEILELARNRPGSYLPSKIVKYLPDEPAYAEFKEKVKRLGLDSNKRNPIIPNPNK